MVRHYALLYAIEHYLKACAGKPDCTEMKLNWVISISEQSGFCTDFTLVSFHIVTVSIDDHSLLNHFVWVSLGKIFQQIWGVWKPYNKA